MIPHLIRNLVNDGVCILAGGALRHLFTGEEPSDYDLFFTNRPDVEVVRDALAIARYELTFECPEGKLYTYQKEEIKVQLICEEIYHNAEHLLDTFDIIPGCAALLSGGEVLCHPQFLYCLATGKMFFHRITYPASTLRRIVKYGRHDFYIPADAAVWFVQQLRHQQFDETALLRVYID